MPGPGELLLLCLLLRSGGASGVLRGAAPCLTKVARCLGLSHALGFRLVLPKLLVPVPSPGGSLRIVVLRVMPEMPQPHRKRKTV